LALEGWENETFLDQEKSKKNKNALPGKRSQEAHEESEKKGETSLSHQLA